MSSRARERTYPDDLPALERGGFSTLVEFLEENNDISPVYHKDSYILVIGSDLVDTANGETLEKRYEGIESGCYNYGACGCHISYEWLNSASGEELHSLDEDLESIKYDYPLLNDDDYSRLQFEMVENVVSDSWYEFDEEEKAAARDFLYGCSFFSDFIDFSESDLMEYVGRNKEEEDEDKAV